MSQGQVSHSSRPLNSGDIKKVGDNGLTRGREIAEQFEENDLLSHLFTCLKLGMRDDCHCI